MNQDLSESLHPSLLVPQIYHAGYANNKGCGWTSHTQRGAYPITSTALLSSGSSSKDRAIGSHRLSLATILTPSRPLLFKVYRSSLYSQAQSNRKTESRGRYGLTVAMIFNFLLALQYFLQSCQTSDKHGNINFKLH